MLGALVVLAGISAAAARRSDRIVEHDIASALPGSDQLLKDVPLIDPPRRTAGYFKLNRTHDAHMFYFFFESRSKPKDDPVILWMTGGPGCSSEIAIFAENGPYKVAHNMTLYDNPYGWDVDANVIYVDQPINTGFSYSDDPRDRVRNEALVAEDMLDFLQEFFEVHTEMADNDFFVTGESYAGHYVPAVANRVYRAKELGEGAPVNIKGAAIGNGMTAPAVQFGAYADFALQEGLISKGARDAIQWWYPLCKWGADFCSDHNWAWLCGLTLQYCQLAVFQRVLRSAPAGLNWYDIRKQCIGPLCYDFSDIDAYLNSALVRKTLGVGDIEWEECNMGVNADFFGDFMRDNEQDLVPMLEDDIRVLIYAGDRDLICNWLGNRRWVDALAWSGSEGWSQAQEQPWSAKGSNAPAGTVTSYDTLTFVKVFQAGHMVPMDQPQASLHMISQWARGHSLAPHAPSGSADTQHTARMVAHGQGKPGLEQLAADQAHTGEQHRKVLRPS